MREAITFMTHLLKHLSYGKKLRELQAIWTVQPEEEKAWVGGWTHIISVYEYLMEENEDEGARLFSVALSDRTRVNEYKLKHMKFHLNIRKNFLQ